MPSLKCSMCGHRIYLRPPFEDMYEKIEETRLHVIFRVDCPSCFEVLKFVQVKQEETNELVKAKRRYREFKDAKRRLDQDPRRLSYYDRGVLR